MSFSFCWLLAGKDLPTNFLNECVFCFLGFLKMFLFLVFFFAFFCIRIFGLSLGLSIFHVFLAMPKVAAISGQVAQTLADWTKGVLRDSA